MLFRPLMALLLLLLLALLATGCGFNPPGAPPPEPDNRTTTDGPNPDTVRAAIAGLPPQGGAPWHQTARGHATNCRLYWVQVSTGTDASAAAHLLLFDRNTPLGTATEYPRPYTNVITSGHDTVMVQYQWHQGADQPCCPTGIAQVRFQLGSDGKLKALDPIPNQ